MATEYTGLPSTTLQELQCINKEDPLVLSRVLNTLAVHRPQVVTYANLAAQNNEPGNVAIKTIAQQARILKELGNQTKSFHLQVMKAVGYRLQTTDEHSGNAFDLIKDMRLQGRDANFLHVLMAHIDEYVTPSQLRVAAIPSSAGEKALCRRVSAMNQKLEEYGYRIESDISHIGSVQYVAGYRLRQMEYRK